MFDGLSLALLAGLTVLAFLTFQHYGVSFDEEVQDNYGKAIVEWYRTLGRDRAAVEYLDLYYYGGLFDTLAALFNQVSPFGHWESRHLLNALVGIVGLAGCWRFGRHLGGAAAGFLALALLALMPSYYGMMFINPKDVPFAVGMVWSAYFLTRIAERLPEAPRDELIKLTIAAGLTMGIRVGGFLVLFF
ncbi:MAG: glycosyltransferase family 39 protein, partial [Rhodospirillales bacterium]|nr:glycosyltransferase family 39 protein [Rhodospirillales bacterium]